MKTHTLLAAALLVLTSRSHAAVFYTVTCPGTHFEFGPNTARECNEQKGVLIETCDDLKAGRDLPKGTPPSSRVGVTEACGGHGGLALQMRSAFRPGGIVSVGQPGREDLPR
jgi:hypothetical protein